MNMNMNIIIALSALVLLSGQDFPLTPFKIVNTLNSTQVFPHILHTLSVFTLSLYDSFSLFSRVFAQVRSSFIHGCN